MVGSIYVLLANQQMAALFEKIIECNDIDR